MLIFEAPESEIGCHPEAEEKTVPPELNSISFYCDDLAQTVADLKAKGVEFTDEITDAGFGLITHFQMPGGVVAELYEPRYKAEYQ